MIKNLPTYAEQYSYVVATMVDHELWFWGAYRTLPEAVKAAQQAGGYIIDMQAEG